MRKIFTTYAAKTAKALALAAIACLGIQAANATEIGEIELGKTYEIEQFKPVSGWFVAPQSGKVLIEGENLGVFTDAERTKEVTTQHAGYASLGSSFTFNAENGTKYYLYNGFPMSSKIRVSMEQELVFVNVDPAEGSYVSPAGIGSVNIQFNSPVTVGRATLTTGTTSARVGAAAAGSYISVDISTKLSDWLDKGIITKGQEFTLSLTDIKSAIDGKLYNGDGNYSVTYKSAGQPAKLLSYKFPNNFKSYFVPGDPDGIATLTFDKDLKPEGPVAKISFGNPEAADGQYYIETLPVKVEGPVASIDLTGKSRRVAEMIGSAEPDQFINIQVIELRDLDGNYVQTTSSGAIGSFSFNCNYVELPRVDVMADFLPANGGSLVDVDKLEIWISGLKSITFDGFKFEYADGNDIKSTVVAKEACEFTPDNDNEGTYMVAIPAEVKGKSNITVTLENLVSTDGVDHTNDVKAKYDAFVIVYSSPADGAELARLNNGDVISVETNYAEKYPEMFLTYEVIDLDAAEGEESVIKTAAPLTLQDDKSQKATVSGSYRLVRGHRYNVLFTAWENENAKNNGADNVGTATLLWHGTSDPFVVSDVRLTNITPSQTETLKPSDNVFTLEFDGMVNILASEAFILADGIEPISFAKLEAKDAVVGEDSSNEFSNIWVLTAAENYMEHIGPAMQLSIRATDMDGNLVVDENESNPKESFVFVFDYKTTQSGLDSVIAPENGKYTVYNLQGILVATVESAAELNSLPAGLYIVNGTKTVIK